MSAELSSPSEYRSGVGIVLVNPKGLIFLGKRRDHRDPPWQMPQGGIQADELPMQAVLREIQEELGVTRVSMLELRPDWLGYDYPDVATSKRAVNYRGQRHLWFLMRYDGQDHEIRLDSPHGEFSDWRWAPASEVIDHVVSFKQPVYRQVLRFFAPTIQQLASLPLPAVRPLRARSVSA